MKKPNLVPRVSHLARREPTTSSTHMWHRAGIDPGPRWWKAGVFTNATCTLLTQKGSSLRWLPCDSVLYLIDILQCKLVCYIWSRYSLARRLDIPSTMLLLNILFSLFTPKSSNLNSIIVTVMVTNVDPKHLADLKEPVVLRFQHLKVKYDKPALLLRRIVIKLFNLAENKEKVNIVPATELWAF